MNPHDEYVVWGTRAAAPQRVERRKLRVEKRKYGDRFEPTRRVRRMGHPGGCAAERREEKVESRKEEIRGSV